MASEQKTVKEGWLQKQGHLWKSWLRRYFKQTGEPGGGISKDSVVVETGEAVDCV